MDIIYINDINKITIDMLSDNFFEGWSNKPSVQKHFDILQSSYVFWVALENAKVIGFVNAVSDGILSAYIPLLEVLPEYRNKGIGGNLIKLMLESLSRLYMIDLCCDFKVQDYYLKFGMQKSFSMIKRNYGTI